ncbi:MAG: tRNA (adenosine(37)-N6)-threonylcarbamoyltransferase complex ATPase subunit type 1 TsaE [Phycisphaerales bacterium]|nr:tRNA (adenosine(37)-N6)-threonylcarbamoyltransferase complex ATPase subunit type 1 TsaE [Phycisphaerales bacterium]
MTDQSGDGRVVETMSPEETLELGAGLASGLSGGEMIAIDGPLGSGKTVLVRGLVKGLGGDGSLVGSPTFGLAHEYPIRNSLRLVHVDCYRLSGPADLESIGWDDFAGASDAITVIEWSARIESVLPSDRMQIAVGHTGDMSRIFEFCK